MTSKRFDPGALLSLGSLPLRARHIVDGALTGLHRARLHGSTVEFAEHKEYAPGDEIRHIDWKAYAKVDRYYVKRYEQESQLTAHLLLDVSASMGFSGGSAGDQVTKLSYAAHLLAAIAHLLIRQRDRVGLCTFGDPGARAAIREIPPSSRPNQAAAIFAVLEQVLERGARGHETAAAALTRTAESTRRRRALIVLASDLLGDYEDAVAVLELLRARGHEPVVFHILDPHELELPYSGLTRFRSMEDEREILVDPDNLRRQYLDRLQEFLARVSGACTNSGVDYHLVSTDTPIERTLLEFLERATATRK